MLEAVERRTKEAATEHPDFAASDVLALAATSTAEMRARGGARIPFRWLEQRLQLSPTEQRVLWLLVGHEVEPSIRASIRALNTEEVSDPTASAVSRVVYGGDRRLAEAELGAQGRLLKLGLIERSDAIAHCPGYRRTFSVSPRVLSLALGNDALDPVVDSLRCHRGEPAAELEISGGVDEALSNALQDGPRLVVLHGAVGSGRRSAIRSHLAKRGLASLEVDCERFDADPAIALHQVRAVAREAKLLERVPVLVDLDVLGQRDEGRDRLGLLDGELDGLVLATSRQMFARRWNRPVAGIELKPLSSTSRAVLWSRALPALSDGDAEIVASMYPLSPALVSRTGSAVERVRAGRPLSAAHIASAVRAIVDDSLAGLASRISTSQTWEDLVLPPDQQLALEELIARIRQRSLVYEQWGFAAKVGKGLGVAALFSGPPGTGKSMAACLVAKELGVDVYQVDLSKIISKFIGETERNLARLFDAAESGHAILLFDEADALFGKRTEVRTSNDRHANQEVNYLLQRLESFSGICILTSNHEAAIDEAFRRRLSTHVRFPVPEEKERRKLWRAMHPANAPVSGNLELDELATVFAMSGGYIRNAVLRAAFLAADRGTAIGSELLSEAAQLEYDALGKLTTFSREA